MTTFIYQGQVLEAPETATFRDLAIPAQPEYDAPIILAKVGQKLVELAKPVSSGEDGFFTPKAVLRELTFITTRDRDGHKTYERGATMMFLRAMRHVFGKGLKSIKVEYAIGDSLYFSVEPSAALTEDKLQEVQATMERYAAADEKFIKEKLSTDAVIELFHHHGMTDKERLFHYRRNSMTNVYRLGNYVDYYYGYMPPSTGMITRFSVERAEGGAFLVLPKETAPEEPGDSHIPKKLFQVMHDTTAWGEGIGVPTVAALNDAISSGRGSDIILASEAYQEHKIGEIARQIRRENRRIVMIAGPSSSGKTSFSHRLSIQLANVGLKAHPIAVDNYFVDRERTPRDEKGEYDFECLEALDTELFNDHMVRLLQGERVEMPTFNFKTGHPEYNGNFLHLGSDEVLVIEGIHGLNDAMSFAIEAQDKFKIYISAVTALNIDEHNRIPTTDNREIRRMVRDARTRGTSARNTIRRWPSVRRGEERHIFPYQEAADVMFNSASLYELSVLKTFAEPLLFAIPTDAPEYPEAKRLLRFLDYFLGLSCEDVPKSSLIREFIGGSIFLL